MSSYLKHDPVEDTRRYRSIIWLVELELRIRLLFTPRHMGFCFRYWSMKQDILHRYGIEWRTPSQMNPRVRFD